MKRPSSFTRFTTASLAAVAIWAFAVPAAQALALLVPTDRSCDPLELRSQVMDVRIDNQAAQTHIKQVFHNRYGQPIEATYLMPIPKGAHVTEFVMMMNGKPVRGEVLEKDKAREIYTDIVRRMRDPGLIEYVDQELFRARIFPIPPNGDQQVEITVTHLLALDNGIVEYEWPFEAPAAVKQRGRPESPDEFDVKLDIRSKVAIKTVYSPTHKIDVDRKDEKQAVVRLDQSGVGDPVFRCYYTLSDKAVGMHVLTHREAERDGAFLLMISPGEFYDKDNLPPVDFTFVLDTSGSMNDDNKMDQAKKALNHCLGSLRAEDAFTIVRFSTEAEVFEGKFLEANKQNLERARKFIEELRARGGTNIDEALEKALKLEPREGRLQTILFITDGLPTVGVTNVDTILGNIKERNRKGLRVFACGVGFDVNARLLDRVAEQTRAVSAFIRPQQDLEVAIGQLFDKISHPVMTDLEIDWGELTVRDVYPKTLPDLFAGTQLTVFGRYQDGGAKAVTLRGKVGKDEKKSVYEANFKTDAHDENEFVQTLWATRRVGYLLDQIRDHGESKELRDEVIDLAKRYGIVTPYTSYLVQEDRPQVAMGQRPEPAAGPIFLRRQYEMEGRPAADALGAAGGTGRRMRGSAPTEGAFQAQEPIRGPGLVAGARLPAPPADRAERAGGDAYRYAFGVPSATTGEAGVQLSERLSVLKGADVSDMVGAGDAAAVTGQKAVAGRAFLYADGAWKEVSDKKDADRNDAEKPKKLKTLKIKYLGDAYFDLVRLRPDLKKVFVLGEKIELEINDYRVVIGPEGEEKLTKEQLGELALKKA